MSDLLIADPPHQPGDLQRAAELLGLAVAELRLKINYQVPEIWYTDVSAARLDEADRVLREAGLRIVRVPERALAAVPDAVTAMRAACAGGLALVTEHENVKLARDQAAVLVVFTAQAPAPADAPPPRVDPFWFENGLQRWRVSADTTVLEGVGDAKGGSRTAALLRFVSACEATLPRATVDRRLENMKLRHRWRRGPIPAGAPQRKGYSYASPGLDALLAAIEPGLEEISQPELTSRLAFLTWGARM